MEENEVLQQTNGHNHPVDGVEAEVERVKHGLRKQAREEVTPIPTIYDDALVDISTQVEDEAGGVRKAKRRKVVQREEKIKSLQHELTAGERTIDSYISAIRHCVVAFDF